MDDIHRHPLKLYVQDIFRATNLIENKYTYEIFGIKFKNVCVHGIITAVYNRGPKATNIELTDATGTIQIYYDCTKNKNNLNDTIIKDLTKELTKASKYNDNAVIMSSMLDLMMKKKDNILNFEEGNYISVIGDIFVDERNIRMLSAYECKITSVERDLIWMEELRYLYEKFYLWNKISDDTKQSVLT